MDNLLIQILLSLVSFVGITIVYFLKMSFQKLEVLQMQIQELKIEVEKLKK
jgi:hypothetical protein